MCLSTSLLLSNIFALFRALDHYFSESTSPPSEEWQEFFKPAVVDVICPVFLTTLRKCSVNVFNMLGMHSLMILFYLFHS